jgi:hypothetical protein
MFRAAYLSSSGALTLFAASGLHTPVVTGRSQVWVGTGQFLLRLDYGRSPQAYVNQRMQIQLELLMMRGMPLETCWVFNERWNNNFYYKVASCWLFLLSHTAMYGSMNIKFTESKCKRPTVYHQCNDPLRLGHPYRSRCHSQKKQKATSQTTISSKPTPTIPIKRQYPTETEMKMANWPVIRSKRFPHCWEPHHVRKSTGWTLASSLVYEIHCTPIADQIIIIIIIIMMRLLSYGKSERL